MLTILVVTATVGSMVYLGIGVNKAVNAAEKSYYQKKGDR